MEGLFWGFGDKERGFKKGSKDGLKLKRFRFKVRYYYWIVVWFWKVYFFEVEDYLEFREK